MIVQPDFPDHFKTKALVKITGDASAPLAVIRLWGHCQNSRRWQFPGMTPEQLSAVCAWGGRKPKCHTALIKAGFVKALPGGGFEAHQWDEQNGKLIANWTNGPKGGRPKKGSKKGRQNNPSETRGLSGGNPPETDKIRSDQIPRSRGVGTGEGVEGGREDLGSAESRPTGGFVAPRFEAIPAGVFSRELKEMVAVCRREIGLVRSNEAAWVWEERENADAREGLEWTREALGKEADPMKLEKLRADLEMFEGRLKERVKVRLKPEALRVIEAWRGREREIEQAMAGVKG